MLERFLFEAEQQTNVLKIFIATLLITITIGFVNSLIGGNSLFFVAMLCLALAYPVVNYIRSMEREEIERQMRSSMLIKRHEKEIIVFLTIFVAAMVGMYICLPLVHDFTFQKQFVEGIRGKFTFHSDLFIKIFLNNLMVALFTFIISVVVFSGLVFVLMWNASIIVYFLSEFQSHSQALQTGLSILFHGVFEAGGYILAGIAGSLLTYRMDRKNKFDHKLDVVFLKDFAILLAGAVLFIFIGAVIESL